MGSRMEQERAEMIHQTESVCYCAVCHEKWIKAHVNAFMVSLLPSIFVMAILLTMVLMVFHFGLRSI